MNNKGLTLVEVIAVLVVLSIIAVIVSPNIAIGIKEYKERTLETQLSNVKGALKNWTADNIDKVTCAASNTGALYVSISELQTNGYLDEKISNPNGGYMDDTETFGLVSCETISDETGNLETNYKYSYATYYDNDDYIKKMAIQYIKEHTNETGNVTVATLKTNGYIYNTITKLDDSTYTIPSKTVHVEVETIEDGKYKYTATFN